jgi:hypothetical protein
MARVQAKLDEAIDRESAALEGAARAEIHEGAVQALQRLHRTTLKAALSACHEEYRAAVEQCDANDRYQLKLSRRGGLLLLSERNRRVLKAERTARRLEEAWDRVLQRERDERVRHTGTPQRHCQVCLMPTIEDPPWCSRQCEDAARARKYYEPRFVPGLFRCAWCRMYFWVPDPDAAGIHDMAPFCSRECLEASVEDLDEHVDMNFSTVKRIPPPPPTIAARQRAFANYLQRFLEDLGRRESRHNAALTPSRPIEGAGAREVPAVPGHPDILGGVRTLLLEHLGPEVSLTVRPGDLVDDLRKRFGTKISPEVVGRWLRELGAQRLSKDGRGARYQVSQDHLRS